MTILTTVSQRLATWRVVAVTGALFLVSAVAMFATSLPFSIPTVTELCGTPPPDVRFFTPGVEVRQYLIGCGDAGREAYLNLQRADLVYPAICGLFLASALALILTRLFRPGTPAIALAVLPLLGSTFDYLENLAAWTALTVFPQDAPLATDLLGVMSIAKQSVTWTAWAVLVLALGSLLCRNGRRRRAAQNLHSGPGSTPARQHKLPA